MKHQAALLLLFFVPVCAQKHPLEALMDAARQQSPALKELLPANIHALKERGGAAVWGQEFLFAIDIETTPTISVDRQAPLSLTRVAWLEPVVPVDEAAYRRDALLRVLLRRTADEPDVFL